MRETYLSLRKALPQVSYYATTDKLKVFLSNSPGEHFTETAEVNGAEVTVTGESDGKAIVIHPSAHEFLIIGYRCGISWKDQAFNWPELKSLRIERGAWIHGHWRKDSEPSYGVDQSDKTLSVDLETAQAIRVIW